MITIGSTITSQKSGDTGTVQEIVPNPNGTYRVRFTLEDCGVDRWTTYTPSR